MARVAVTGGSGKLGAAVVAELLAHSYDVVNLDVSAPAEPVCPHVRVDLTDLGQAVEALSGIDDRYGHLDAVVHLAAVPAPGLTGNAATFANNHLGTYHVFTAARVAGIGNLVWASSETVLGLPFRTPPPYLPVDERYPGRPESSYALGKHLDEAMAEQFCRWDPGLKAVGLRFSNVMLPGDYARFPYDDPYERSWNLWGYIDARDGAQAVRRALEYPVAGAEVFIVANADTVSSRPTAELAATVFPQVPVRRKLTGHETLLSIDKARRLLGYEPAFGWRSRG